MRALLLLFLVGLLTAHSFAHGSWCDITRTRLQVSGLTFSVKCEQAAKNNGSYTVEIKADDGRLDDATFSLAVVNQKNSAKERSLSFGEPDVRNQVKVIKNGQRVTCEFTAHLSSESSLVVCIPAGPTSVEFYFIKLKDFAPH